MSKSWIVFAGVVVALSPFHMVYAGPDHVEFNAGSLPATAEALTGAGPRHTISGELAVGFVGKGDYEDMYQIYIADPQAFKASTSHANGGFASFDSELWLFSADGHGVLGNRNDGNQGGTSTIQPPATDGTSSALNGPGLYYLAITGNVNEPLSRGNPIFHFGASTTEVSGPDGAGGAGVITGWNGTGTGQTGTYIIRLNGVIAIAPVAASSPMSLLACLLIVSGSSVVLIRRTVGA